MNHQKKSIGQGKSLAKRHRIQSDKRGGQHITNDDLRRLARSGGVQRISQNIYDVARQLLVNFVSCVVKYAVISTESAQRNTVQAIDIVYALKQYGRDRLLHEES